MHDTDLIGEAESAVAAWAVGDADACVALEQVCGCLEGLGALCALVGGDEGPDDVVNAPGGVLDAAALERIAARSRPNRALYTDRDESWSSLFTSATTASAWDWVACEPVCDRDGTLHGMLVALGRKGASERDRVLVALPDLARLCAGVRARERSGAVAAKVTHQLNNLLASVVANVEYASSLVEGARADEPLLGASTPAERADFVMALENASSAARQLGHHVGEIGRLVRSRKPT